MSAKLRLSFLVRARGDKNLTFTSRSLRAMISGIEHTLQAALQAARWIEAMLIERKHSMPAWTCLPLTVKTTKTCTTQRAQRTFPQCDLALASALSSNFHVRCLRLSGKVMK